MNFDEWNRLWIETAIARGHNLETDEDGEVNIFAYTPGEYHNGPACTACGWAVCMHCHSDPNDIPECTVINAVAKDLPAKLPARVDAS